MFQPDPRTAVVFGIIVILLVIEIVILLARLVRQKREQDAVTAKYKDYIDRDAEILKREVRIKDLAEAQAAIELANSQKLTSFNAEYANAKAIFDKLRRELALTEETLEIQSYGLYKPHFDFKTADEYRATLEANYERQKSLIASGKAAVCATVWTVSGSKKDGERMIKQATKLMLRAFNGECDSAVLKVKWNNIAAMEQRIIKAFEAINKTGVVNQIALTSEFLAVKIDELRLAHELEEKLYQEKEEQRRIAEEMREEERAQREFEQAKKDAEDEEKRYQKALDKARAELGKATGAELDQLGSRIRELELQLKEAQAQRARAISRAQMTKAGHVYVISNIGSFGDDVFKIGMTRRLEPTDRVRELGDASVPFAFDIHAMVYTENAPELEWKLHAHFDHKRVNLTNERKEFFNVSLAEIEDYAKSNNLPIKITKLAEAKEYRETLAIRSQQKPSQPFLVPAMNAFPETLLSKEQQPPRFQGGDSSEISSQ